MISAVLLFSSHRPASIGSEITKMINAWNLACAHPSCFHLFTFFVSRGRGPVSLSAPYTIIQAHIRPQSISISRPSSTRRTDPFDARPTPYPSTPLSVPPGIHRSAGESQDLRSLRLLDFHQPSVVQRRPLSQYQPRSVPSPWTRPPPLSSHTPESSHTTSHPVVLSSPVLARSRC